MAELGVHRVLDLSLIVRPVPVLVTATPRTRGSDRSLDTHRTTVAVLFGGDEAAFAARNPMELLRSRRYEGSAGMVVHGRDDVVDGHTWSVAIEALRTALSWPAARGGLLPTGSGTAGPRPAVGHS